MDYFEKNSRALEFDKVLERLAQFTGCEDARYEALHLKPETDINMAKALLAFKASNHKEKPLFKRSF
ncbi:MAG: hypothetical protein IJL77_06435 [Clostridia bacterium]|nr:hypothetical protein [Clostridia bacterium]